MHGCSQKSNAVISERIVHTAHKLWSACRKLQSLPTRKINNPFANEPLKRARATVFDKAVIDRRLRPRCCHLESYFKRPKSSPVRPLACNWYYINLYSPRNGSNTKNTATYEHKYKQKNDTPTLPFRFSINSQSCHLARAIRLGLMPTSHLRHLRDETHEFGRVVGVNC